MGQEDLSAAKKRFLLQQVMLGERQFVMLILEFVISPSHPPPRLHSGGDAGRYNRI